jgi:uncharacterized YigZ family protein
MKTIKDDTVYELIINKSKFITVLKRVDDINLVKDIIDEIKKEYEGATHYCYAYIIGNNKKSSDDKEPSGTAGLPVLSVLEKEHLNNILCLVIRYYGGVKLGAPGLIRAYSRCVSLAIEESTVDNLINGIEVVITFNYDNTKAVEYLLKNAKIINSSFNEEVTYTFHIEYTEYEKVKEELLMFINTIYTKENVFI